MPLIAHSNLPSFERLEKQGETILSEERASQQAIRALHNLSFFPPQKKDLDDE